MCSDSNAAISTEIMSASAAQVMGQGARRKLWQLDIAYHCAIIGTCLSLKELRAAAHKFKVTNTLGARMTDYELHSLFVGLASAPTESTRHIQKLLDKKYSRAIRQFAKAKTADSQQQLWCEAVASGDISSAFWAMMTNSRIDIKIHERVVGDVHMLSHISGASVRHDIRKLGDLQKEQQESSDLYSRNTSVLEQRLRKKEAEISRLRESNEVLECRIVELEKSKKRLDDLEREGRQKQLELMVENLTGQCYQALSKAKQEQQKNLALEDQVQQVVQLKQDAEKRERQRAMELGAVETALSRLLNTECAVDCELSDTQSCPLNNVLGKNILYVGGRASQCSNFRALVEQSNGEFLYHDGGKDDGRQRLNSILAQADAVVCPLDCVSHDAYNCVKKHCERQDKQLVMIAHASLSSFAKGLEEIAA
ncbi:hypothetical protein A9Q99_07405 [Gammaproteobacteria bacterium 45_16_T64]|nr:hypothetical protein A9Q99_07405 [Gammaproteobacteria bacterium 45_16_T64]